VKGKKTISETCVYSFRDVISNVLLSILS